MSARIGGLILAFAAGATLSSAGLAQSLEAGTAINQPDKASWELFAYVVSSVPSVAGKVLFETWASNEDTFVKQPIFPGASGGPACPAADGTAPSSPAITPIASPKILNIPALQEFAPPGLQPHVSPDGSEEVRRNEVTFDFIVCKDLFTRAGLKAAFAAGKPITFPMGAMEVKANWIPAADVDASQFYVSAAPDGTKYALVGMHIISKLLPNWTWATFEHRANPGRCDYIGCHDSFGAVVADVAPNEALGRPYNACTKSEDLKKLFADAGLPAVWENYCLKGTQVDFVTPTGIPTRLGNSVTENSFVDTSSCITCHARASINDRGRSAAGAGFLVPPDPALCPSGPQMPCSPNGAPKPAWYWLNVGQPEQSMSALQTDFIWSIALHAIQ